MAEAPQRMRLDKWLWVARFFKTRRLAAEAIAGGKIHLNGQRSKPGREIRPGMALEIHKEQEAWEVEIIALAAQRRPAPEARLLYQETPASAERREKLRQQRALQPNLSNPGGRPDKRQRRKLRELGGHGRG